MPINDVTSATDARTSNRGPSGPDMSGTVDGVAERSSPTQTMISHAFGFRPGVDLDRLGQLADALEAEAFADKLQRAQISLPLKKGTG